MNHDVFISYSSKNKTTALAVCHVLEQHRIKCWMAPRDIPPGAYYGDVIDEAIIACRVFVIIFSEPATVSQWVNGELNLAFSKEKHIVPYRIDDAPLKGAMRLILNQTHWIEAYPDAESKFDELVAGIARYLDILTVDRQTHTNSPSIKAATAAILPSAMKPVKTYKVGDYYYENGREGVVFEIDNTGRHGKIVGMKQEVKTWCRGLCSLKKTGATDSADGMKNMRQIIRINGWREKYPAFAWCAAQGDGWYLPAFEELKKMTHDNKVYDAVNQTLSQYGGHTLTPYGGFSAENFYLIYWSSSEIYSFAARTVNRPDGDIGWDLKPSVRYVRAVFAF